VLENKAPTGGQKMSKQLRGFAKKMATTAFVFFCMVLCSLCPADTDPLASSLKPEIQALFGSDSTVAYGIYIAEIVMGSVAYVKTKNLMLLLGVPILMLFTHTMFTYISS
jgi:type IV conjugative transfer system pilin TraA